MTAANTNDVAEVVLAEVRRLLDRRTVSLDEDFFMIGGDSLDAVELVARIESRFGPVPALSAIFSMRSIGEIVAAVRAAEE